MRFFNLVWLTCSLRMAWKFILPLLKSKVLLFISDVEVQALAIKAAERATHLDLDGDAKFDHSVAELRADLRKLSKRYYNAWLALAVEAAYQNIKTARRDPIL